ncbi:MAG: DUF6468 domain-containing protein [Phenylobacterium sp.]
MISILLNLLLAALLCGALWMGWRLNQRLKVLREGQMGFAKAVADLDAAAARAERGLADLKAASDEMAEVLVSRIERARILASKLDQQFEAGARAGLAVDPRDPNASEADIERLSRNLGSLLAQSREARARGRDAAEAVRRAPADLAVRRPVSGVRRRPEFEDELFLGGEAPASARSAFGGAGR